MKTICFLLSFTLFTTINAQDIARVNKINGIEVYILSEPIRKYDVVMGQGNTIQWTSFVTGGLVNDNIATKITKYVRALQDKATSEKIVFDAIIYTNGKSVSAIKFTDEKTEENDRVAEVQKMSGIPVFIMSEPLKNYTVENEKGGGVKWKSLVTAGLANNSIEEDIQKYVGKFQNLFKKGKIDAIQYSRGRDCNGIKYKP
ncbi:MAG TPA: hypothetical protein PLE75_03415 [Ferruginibacter sp.]|nr:hypothetical protein [Ferruginibacter sp.]HRO05709.1 hypothetical protein [Ferruginibacter sp.]HRO97520.1 hypothetical protein [Ferruginibacter sp.]HRP49111.1 hypothetical protein [Ferruginibacter sp.]